MSEKKGFFSSWFKKEDKAIVKQEKLESVSAVEQKRDSDNHVEETIIDTVDSIANIDSFLLEEDGNNEQFIETQNCTMPQQNITNDNESLTILSTEAIQQQEGFFKKLFNGLLKTKQNVGSGIFGLFQNKKIDAELFEELEEQLLIADIGINTTSKIIKNLTLHASKQDLKNSELLYQQLKQEMALLLQSVDKPLIIKEKKPFIILMIGVNGVGKTTTIGKLACKYQQQGKRVMLAAGDTFRAAAVEQLQVWGERNNIPVISQSTGSDSAAVIYDAIESAKNKGYDVLIADTAGRLQNKDNLMQELKKIVKVMQKHYIEAPHEIMLVLDAGTGQNAISQIKLFNEAVGITGITITKLDGTAKGGVLFALADQFNIPIRYIGIGEQLEDLRDFNAQDFIEALFA